MSEGSSMAEPKFLDRVALLIVSAVVGTAGLIALVAFVHVAVTYPAGVTMFGFAVLFVWALWRVLTRYRS